MIDFSNNEQIEHPLKAYLEAGVDGTKPYDATEIVLDQASYKDGVSDLFLE